MATQVTLNADNYLDLLKHFVNLGYRRSGVLNIKQAARLAILFRYLNKSMVNSDPKLTETAMFDEIFKAIDLFTAKKGYEDIDEAFGIMSIVDFINTHVLKPAEAEEPVLQPSSIKEI